MNAEYILNALGGIRDEFVADAARPAPRRRTLRRVGVLAAALALILALAIPAAAYTDTGYRILYALSPAAAQALKPVSESCEANGVRMEVREAAVDGDTAWFRIALTDTTGQLFDGPVDLFDSYTINRGFDSVGSCRQEDYDEDERTASFLIQLSTMDGSPIDPGKVTFRVRELRCHTEIWESTAEDVDLANAVQAPAALTYDPADSSYVDPQTGYRYDGPPAESPFLVPGEPVELCPGAAVTGLGWLDGKLHVQVREAIGTDLNTTGIVWLTDGSGQTLQSDYECIFDQKNETRYDEHIFDIAPEELGEYTLAGWFNILEKPLQGPWEVTFSLA